MSHNKNRRLSVGTQAATRTYMNTSYAKDTGSINGLVVLLCIQNFTVLLWTVAAMVAVSR